VQSICVTAWPPHRLAEIVAHLTMTHGLFPKAVLPDVWISFLGATWSLSTEWQFYLLAVLLHSSNRRLLVGVLLGLAVAGLAWRLAAPEMWQFSRAFLPNKAHFFALGVASVAVVRTEAGAFRHYGMVLAATLALCATQAPIGRLLPPLAWTLCLAVQMRPDVAGWRQAGLVLSSRAARYFGGISYCVYLVNEPILKLASGVLSWVAGGDAMVFTFLWIPLAILLTLGVSSWLHRRLEVPATRWGRSLVDGPPRGKRCDGTSLRSRGATQSHGR
jgi:peptidoglycan/LPS O-acetylase OafA/YrhL